jgi:phosphoribosylaminoimidazolecarboxamide formyltransferase / IMP cyclohydrolase
VPGRKNAIISVYDKSGVVDLARELVDLGWRILSTGGTARALRDDGLPVTDVAEVTGFPEMMDGRVKTLHPIIHAGLLCVRDSAEHMAEMRERGIELIDLVVVNLYPFEATIAKPDVTDEEAIENIDIGGPTMLRASAKNHRYVTVVVDPADYAVVLDELKAEGATTLETRRRLAAKVYATTSRYDGLITEYLSKR